MAHEPRQSPTFAEGEPGYGGNAEGVLAEQQQRPGVGAKVKNSLMNVKDKIKGSRSPGEHPSHFPGSVYKNDPQLNVGHPKDVYGNTSSSSSSSSSRDSGSGGDKAQQQHSPRSPHPPPPPHAGSPLAVGHNPEFEPQGVGEQAADTVMPGHHVDHLMEPNAPHHQPTAEKLMDKLPGHNENPFTPAKYYDEGATGTSTDDHDRRHHPSPLRDPQRQHVVGEPEANIQHTSENLRRGFGEDQVQSPKKPGFINKLKDMVTGQKPGQGAGTGHATDDQISETTASERGNAPGQHHSELHQTTGNTADLKDGTAGPHDHTHGTESYTQGPTPVAEGDCFGNVKQRLRGGALQDAQAQQTWPSPSKPDYHNMPGAVHTDQQGRPIEGPKEEGKSPKKEGVMSKIMEKLHIGQQKPPSSDQPMSPDATKATTAQHP
ncbi:hypothetical protein Mapa_015576 [Marchantia paleacea]|nr:hypothetical protein Mapa_015576 [Marchantia paleacea]